MDGPEKPATGEENKEEGKNPAEPNFSETKADPLNEEEKKNDVVKER